MRSFPVPFSDDQIDVDTTRRVVLLYRNAWNRESCGTPDQTHSFDQLQADRILRESLTSMLGGADSAELERLISPDPPIKPSTPTPQALPFRE